MKERQDELNKEISQLDGLHRPTVNRMSQAQTVLCTYGVKNARRRQKRRDEIIKKQKSKILFLEKETKQQQKENDRFITSIASLRKLSDNKTSQIRGKSATLAYKTKRISKLSADNNRLSTEFKILENQLTFKTREVENLLTELDEVKRDRFKIDVVIDGRYSDNIRKCIMSLHSMGLGIKQIPRCIRTVSEDLFHCSIEKLPSDTTMIEVLKEANIIGKIHVAKSMLAEENSTLHCDGTTDKQRHFFGYQVSSSKKQSLTLGIVETLKGDTKTQMEELKQAIADYSEIISCNNQQAEITFNKLILSLRNLMTDQHIVNKKFREDFESLRRSLLEKCVSGWDKLSEAEQQKSVRINQWFCLLHVLLGLADATDVAIKEYEQIITNGGEVKIGRTGLYSGMQPKRDTSLTYETIKSCCSLLTSMGHSSAGLQQDFKSWLQGGKMELKNFVHNRFNIYFENSAAVIHHFEDITKFLDNTQHSN